MKGELRMTKDKIPSISDSQLTSKEEWSNSSVKDSSVKESANVHWDSPEELQAYLDDKLGYNNLSEAEKMELKEKQRKWREEVVQGMLFQPKQD